MQRITLITFAVFMVEAIIHYNIGAKSATTRGTCQDGKIIPANPQIPPIKDLVWMAIFVFVFAYISARLIKKQ